MATDKPGWKPLFPPHLAAETRGPLEALLRDATARRNAGNKTMPTKVSDRRQRFWGATGDAPPDPPAGGAVLKATAGRR